MRGAILGFSAHAPKRDVALYVTFGSPSLGIASALSRVFGRVSRSHCPIREWGMKSKHIWSGICWLFRPSKHRHTVVNISTIH